MRVVLRYMAGLTLVATLFLPWFRSGNGSLLEGRQLALAVAGSGGRSLSLALYAVALAGCLVVAIAHLERGAATLGRIGAAVLVGAALALVAAASGSPLGLAGSAPLLAAAAVLALIAAELRVPHGSGRRVS